MGFAFAEELVPEPRKIACPSHLRGFHETAGNSVCSARAGEPRPRIREMTAESRAVSRYGRGTLPWTGAECRAPEEPGFSPGQDAALQLRSGWRAPGGSPA